MPEVGDLIKITSCSNLLSQRVCNVFFYLVGAWTGNIDLEEALGDWNTIVPEAIAGQLSTQVTAGTVTWANMDNPAEVASIVGGFRGSVAQEVVASFAAYSVRLFGTTAVTRSGWKRIPGVPETQVTNGVINNSNVALLDAWAEDALVVPVTAPAPADMTLISVIVGRNPDGTLNLSAVNPVASAKTQVQMTTQNTRKVGRGT